MGELIFYSKIKSFQCFQCLAAVPSHVESLGNLKNKYKIKKVKVRNQTIHNKVQQKQNMRGRRTEPTEKKKKKKKGEGDGETDREEEEKKERRRRRRRRKRRSRRRRSSCFTAPPLLRHRLLPFLLLLCFLYLQMMFRPGIHLPAETIGFCRYSRYATGTTSIFSGTK